MDAVEKMRLDGGLGLTLTLSADENPNHSRGICRINN